MDKSWIKLQIAFNLLCFVLPKEKVDVIFSLGTAEEKSKLLFNIYDIRKVGYLTKDEFYRMIK